MLGCVLMRDPLGAAPLTIPSPLRQRLFGVSLFDLDENSLAAEAPKLVKFMSFRRSRFAARFLWAREKVKRLLQAELERNRKVHGHGLAVQRRRPILPLTQGVHGRLL